MLRFIIRNTYVVYVPLPGTELLGLWDFLRMIKVSYANEVTFGKTLGHVRTGAGGQGDQPCD